MYPKVCQHEKIEENSCWNNNNRDKNIETLKKYLLFFRNVFVIYYAKRDAVLLTSERRPRIKNNKNVKNTFLK